MRSRTYEIVCKVCGTINTYQVVPQGDTFEGYLSIIRANNQTLAKGVRTFSCRNGSCRAPIEIPK